MEHDVLEIVVENIADLSGRMQEQSWYHATARSPTTKPRPTTRRAASTLLMCER